MTGGPALSGFLGNLVGLNGIFISAGIVGLISAVLAWISFSTILRERDRESAKSVTVA
jgi:predicted MFS family arabinose efflux permease